MEPSQIIYTGSVHVPKPPEGRWGHNISMATHPSRVTVYEVLNGTRREIFVGIVARPMVELVGTFRSALPLQAAHWSAADRLEFRSVEFGMTESDARAFIEGYASALAPSGWRMIRETAPSGPSPKR